ncbi:Biopolymer transport protein ExbD [BD1-7 clade bacterium]|uniref:Biopolymer transport protein ExbD n=1 Tax=BD1-7 clade bacterium TaxID=2029982 RepID=A0A5S9NUG8_9GAMM|nr:Biopolymer transport protein ExbD [BD1-7 clade bacterium]CAA0094276.1 Biopolymer transport protein ExbD [BD1-7 clade bacterium]
MQFKRQNRDNSDVNLTPLIDVVFLLLIFFMVSTTFTDKTELAVDLPEATGQLKMDKPQMIEVVINQAGGYVINGHELLNNRFDTLKSAISKLAQGDLKKPLVITADAQSPHQSVVKVMDAAGQLGFTNLSITSIEPNE